MAREKVILRGSCQIVTLRHNQPREIRIYPKVGASSRFGTVCLPPTSAPSLPPRSTTAVVVTSTETPSFAGFKYEEEIDPVGGITG